MIFQSFNLIPSRTSLENVELPMIFAGRPPGERRASASEALESVGLGERLHHHPTQMSGGENQRVAVAGPWSTGPRSCSPTSPPATSTATRPGR